ncbi:MAG: phosphatase PAP2 family protein [Candidatus Zixiibacteriota bacterium]
MNSLKKEYYPFDKFIIGYCLLMVLLILVFGRPVKEYIDEILTYSLAAVLAVLVPLFFDETRGRFSAFVRLMYAAILFGVFYRTTGGQMFLIFDRFFDYQLVAFETMLYGIEPTRFIDQYLLSPPVNEFFSFTYFCYYLMIPAFLITTFVKKDYDIIRHYLTAAMLTYGVSFLLFFLYPIEGPRWHFAGQYIQEVEGFIFRDLVNLVIANGAVRGGCMPSSHIAIALIIMMSCFKHYRRWGWIFLPINIGLAIGTFWGRFHYVSDVYVGVAIGLAAFYLVEKKYDRWTSVEYKVTKNKELKADFVS